MTSPLNATHTDDAEFEALALGFGQRRVVLLGAMLGGFVITGAGLGWLLGSALAGQPPAPGLVMAGVGLVLTGIGWLVTAGLRFTRKLPRPLTGGHEAATGTRTSVAGGWVTFGLVLACVLAIVAFAPRGREPDVLAFLPMLLAIPLVMLLGFYRIRHIMDHRSELYAGWLAKRRG